MTYEYFLKLLLTYKKLEKEFSELHDLGFDFYEGKYKLSETVYNLFQTALESHFTEEGIDWITWFIFENEWGTKDWSKFKSFDENRFLVEDDNPLKNYGATDENGNPICHSFESTWEYVKQYLKH